MVTYKDIAQKIVDREMEVIGQQLAMRTAREVEGIEINDEGDIQELEGEGKKLIDELVKGYEEKTGKVAVSIIARTVKEIGGDEKDLPERLESRM